ncbi:hypothetical protein Goshw_016980 [Gossypium schwendimanii]|uniref:Aconitase/3-isopropylmalate dehydratase large subunit alpha/beta/alpha domain-containing protein n=1 Tax=Gossypium schwendimanii TaxID=34291 RepID=A0A7J9LGB4_GOSSC|nr:hypothetical protein [Gossypium schwendimanii]
MESFPLIVLHLSTLRVKHPCHMNQFTVMHKQVIFPSTDLTSQSWSPWWQPHSPDNRALARECKDVKVDRVYIGSCTGGKTEDFLAAAKVFLASVRVIHSHSLSVELIYYCVVYILSLYPDLVGRHAPRYLKKLAVTHPQALAVVLVWVARKTHMHV